MTAGEEFLAWTYQTRVWEDTYWRGHRALKSPLDLWQYQEIIQEVKPRLVIETGTYEGGSAWYLADMLGLLWRDDSDFRVVSVDLAPRATPEHPHVLYLSGASSTAPEVMSHCRYEADLAQPVIVILDSDHRAPHVLAELHAYADLVTPGSYLIVEDTSINGHPIHPGWGPGPWEAVESFLDERPDFTPDRHREKLGMTFHPRGYLRRSNA